MRWSILWMVAQAWPSSLRSLYNLRSKFPAISTTMSRLPTAAERLWETSTATITIMSITIMSNTVKVGDMKEGPDFRFCANCELDRISTRSSLYCSVSTRPRSCLPRSTRRRTRQKIICTRRQGRACRTRWGWVSHCCGLTALKQ
jgi:hypothetical protein